MLHQCENLFKQLPNLNKMIITDYNTRFLEDYLELVWRLNVQNIWKSTARI